MGKAPTPPPSNAPPPAPAGPTPPSRGDDKALWQEVIEATQQGVWEYDARTDTVHHSLCWKALLGYVGEGTGNRLADWFERIHPDDHSRVRLAMQRHIEGEAPFYESLHRIRHRDGSYHWVQDRGRVVERDADGAPLRILGTKMDASNRQREQELLNHLAESVPGMLFQYQLDSGGRATLPYISPGGARIYDVPLATLREDPSLFYSLIHPEDLPRILAETQRAIEEGGAWHSEYRILLPCRGERWLSGASSAERLGNGAILCHGYVRDITEEKQQSLRLQEAESLLRRLMDEMPLGLCLVDAGGQFYFRNRRFREYFGYPDDQPLTLAQWWAKEYPDPGYRQQVIQAWDALLAEARSGQGEIPRRDYQVTMHDGSNRMMAIGGLTFGDHFMATFEDRTEQLEHSAQLQKMAYIDGLTGIANRRQFDESLQAEWKRCQRSGQPLALLMIDIDHFKRYNDRYGHLQGDACLQAIAKALQAQLGRAQDVLARFGGEEFACLLPECDADGARAVARHLLAAVQALALEHDDAPHTGRVTVSIGVAVQVPAATASPADLLALADAHLYRAKQAGRNRLDDGH